MERNRSRYIYAFWRYQKRTIAANLKHEKKKKEIIVFLLPHPHHHHPHFLAVRLILSDITSLSRNLPLEALRCTPALDYDSRSLARLSIRLDRRALGGGGRRERSRN